MDIQKEREAFVEKYRKVYKVDKSLFVNDSGEFTDLFCQDAWVMWQAAKAQTVPKYNASIDAHQWAIDEIKTEINDGYDLCQDSYLLDVLVERGIEIGKIQAVPEGFILMPKVPTERMVNATRGKHEGAPYLPYSIYESFVEQTMIEAQEQK